MRFIFCLLALVALHSWQLKAQVTSEQAFTIGTKLTFTSTQLQEDRGILIYTPTNFDQNQKYQVIYLFDAEYLFTSTVGIVNALMSSRQIPPSILVGIESTIRVRDYLPPIKGEPKSNHQRWIKKKFPLFGGTKPFTAFLETELFPYIEKQYPVLPNRTMIGYSNSGVFGLNTLVTSPSTFTNYLLISPAAWWGNDEIDEHLAEFSKNYENYSGNLFLSVAGEGRGMYSNALRIAAQLETVAPQSFSWTFKQFEKENHQSTIYPSIYQGLTTLFKDINFKIEEEHGKYATVADIQSYYNSLSKRYGFTIMIPEIVFSDLSDAQFLHQRNSQAIDTLKAFITSYPESSFAYSSLGRGYMSTKQFSLAKHNFEQALKIVKQKHITDPSVTDFLQDMIAAAKSKM